MSKEVNGDVNGISIYFKPWTTEDWFSISVLSLEERIGGIVASGFMKLISHYNSEDTLKKISELSTGTIEIKYNNNDSNILTIPVFIVSKSYFNNFLDINFICTAQGNDEFITKPVSQSYGNIEDAIGTYFPEYDTNVEPVSDLTSLPINQINETGQEFCNKLALGWRPATIFGYNMSGNLFIRDISSSILEDSNKLKVFIGKTRVFTRFPIRTISPLLNLDAYDPWEKESKDLPENLTKKDYSKYSPVNISSRIYRDSYNIFSKGFSSLMEASSYNSRYYASKFYSNGEIKSLTFPDYRIGDVVEITTIGGGITKADKESEPLPELVTKNYLIGSFKIFWTGQGAEGAVDNKHLAFSVTSEIYGLDKDNNM